MKCTQVVAGALLNLHRKHSCLTLNFPTSETVLVIPPHGIQLETHRGLPPWPLAISRRFISLTNLRDVIINEALYGWNVRYYLAAVKEHPSTGFSLDVIFEVSLDCLRSRSILTVDSRVYCLECPSCQKFIMAYTRC